MNRSFRLLSLVFGALCSGAGGGRAEPADPKVKADEVMASVALLDAREQAALAEDPALLKQLVQLTLGQRLLLHEARAAGWNERQEVKAKIERAKDTVLAESWLQSVSAPPPEYPDEAEIKEAYEAQKAALATPRQFRIAQIFIACPPNSDKSATRKAEAKLAAVTKKLAAYEIDFATIARTDSEDTASVSNGGEIGWLAEAQVQPELRPLITRLMKHEMSKPVRLADGWHILKCLDRREAGTPTLQEVRSRIATQLRAAKTKANREAYVAKLLEANPVTVDEAELARRCAKAAENSSPPEPGAKEISSINPQPPEKAAGPPGNPSD
jgi:parvulin-like peptidyl-prolyl isomerase